MAPVSQVPEVGTSRYHVTCGSGWTVGRQWTGKKAGLTVLVVGETESKEAILFYLQEKHGAKLLVLMEDLLAQGINSQDRGLLGVVLVPACDDAA